MVSYVPERKDLIWINFEPQQGKKIKKVRPALVISPKNYNQKTGLALCMPVTSKIKQYPFEVLTENNRIQGAILCDQIRSFDWRQRQAKYITTLDNTIFEEVLNKFLTLVIE